MLTFNQIFKHAHGINCKKKTYPHSTTTKEHSLTYMKKLYTNFGETTHRFISLSLRSSAYCILLSLFLTLLATKTHTNASSINLILHEKLNAITITPNCVPLHLKTKNKK